MVGLLMPIKRSSYGRNRIHLPEGRQKDGIIDVFSLLFLFVGINHGAVSGSETLPH